MKKETIIPADPNDADDFEVSEKGLERGQRARAIRRARKSSGLSQNEFAQRFRIPVGTLQDWEQARVTPPEYAVAYARVIAANPEFVEKAIA